MAPTVLTKEEDLYRLVAQYPEAFLFVGFSEKAQFDSIPDAIKLLDPHLAAAQKRCAGKVMMLIFCNFAKLLR